MNQSTIDRIKAMIAQNTQMNSDLTEILTLAEQGWKQDTDFIASEIQTGKDAVAQQVRDLTARAEGAEAKVIEQETTITNLLAENTSLKTPAEPVLPAGETLNK